MIPILLDYTRNHVTLRTDSEEEKVSWGTVFERLRGGEDIIGLNLRGDNSITDSTGRTLWCIGWYK